MTFSKLVKLLDLLAIAGFVGCVLLVAFAIFMVSIGCGMWPEFHGCGP